MRTLNVIAGAVGALVLGAAATAGEPEVWPFDLSTEGEDVSFVTDTAVDPTADVFAWSYQVDLVEATVQFSIFTFTVDVTDEVPPEFLVGSGETPGPAPVTIIDLSLVYPEPPEPPGISADLAIGLDAKGRGTVDLTNVVLGDVEVDLGPPFGVQTVTLLGVRTVGSVTVTPIDSGPSGDIDGDGTVGFEDLLILLANWGDCSVACLGDLDGDGDVDFEDLLTLLAQWT